MDTLKRKNIPVYRLVAGVFVLCLLPLLLSFFFSLPSGDDFVQCVPHTGNPHLLSSSFHEANDAYLEWSGLWFCYFFLYAFSPLNFALGKPALYGLFMLPRFLFFLFCLWDLVKTASKKSLGVEEKGIAIVVFCITALSIGYNEIYTEAFYWHSASHYIIWQGLCLLTVSLEIRYFDTLRQEQKNKAASAVLLSVVGFVSCSFFYTAVLPGMLYLVLWWVYCVREHRARFTQLLPLAAMIAGGLSSALAPGNTARRATTTDAPMQPLQALAQSAKLTFDVFLRNLGHPVILLSLLVLFVIGMRHVRLHAFRPRHLFFLLAVDLAVLVLTCVPYVLPSEQPELVSLLPNRYLFLMDTCLILSLYGKALCAGFLLNAYRETVLRFLKKRFLPVLGITAVCFCAMLLRGGYYKDFPPLRIVHDFPRMVSYHKTWCGMLEEICFSEEPDITFHVDPMLEWAPVVRPPEITPDASDWKNEAVAKTFGKQSVAVFYDR